MNGIGGTTIDAALAGLSPLPRLAEPIGTPERLARIERAQELMRSNDIAALWLDASTNLSYFTGLSFRPSERLHGAVLLQDGAPLYVSPTFEVEKLKTMLSIEGEIIKWDEHDSPTLVVMESLSAMGISGRLGLDEHTPFFTSEGFRAAAEGLELVEAGAVTSGCRIIKTAQEIALIKRAMDSTLLVHKAAASILRAGITTTEVAAFLHAAHARMGFSRLLFDIVLFGAPTAYPHGVPYPQTLQEGDMVLIDMGGELDGYLSDITRTFVFGNATARQREIWDLEKAAQQAVFDAAQIGAPCSSLDDAARAIIEAGGLGPDYSTPGLPHRAGHGIGLDVHEHPYIVRGNDTRLAAGMCFSNEPMICSYGEFGVRLEDHIHMTAEGAAWFTEPAHSVDDPFGVTV
ncbi:M24 family metallopeptidase [Abyssibius alkaniclasticus]|uniref:M24 family metallopeptidase n=1 Tax=Abyssibius alkaniclasticus TaxID=2881234 RepID=UPI004059FCDA